MLGERPIANRTVSTGSAVSGSHVQLARQEAARGGRRNSLQARTRGLGSAASSGRRAAVISMTPEQMQAISETFDSVDRCASSHLGLADLKKL